MTTTPEGPGSDQATNGETPETAGAELGLTEGEGSTFEPEEDPEGHQ